MRGARISVAASRSPSRTPADFMRLLCDGTLTGNSMARLAPRAFAASMARSTAAFSPAITTCPGELKFTASTTDALRRLGAGGFDVGILEA